MQDRITQGQIALQQQSKSFFNAWPAMDGVQASGAPGSAPDTGRHEPDPDWQPLYSQVSK
jgi:hypothetical protein